MQLGVNQWTLICWENNKKEPLVRMLPRIVDFLGYDPFPEPKSIPDRLLAQRRRLGLSRKNLAETLGIDELTLARWEHGISVPQGRHLALIQKVLGG